MAKKKTKKTSDAEPQVCVMCGLPAFPNSEYCAVHSLVYQGVQKAQEIVGKGDPWSIFIGTAVGAVVRGSTQAIHDAAQQISQQQFNPRAAPGPKSPPPKRDPFEYLGLDPKTATEKDVNAVQRKLAGIYHSDKAASGVNAAKMAEINAAAEACKAALKAKAGA
jgi:hypothetical protein